MCFKGNESGPDIWLTIENGRYLPAPPMIYVPGLRQTQDRLHHKAHHTASLLTSGNNVVRLPPNAMMPTFSPRLPVPPPEPLATDPPPTNSTQPLPETATVTDQAANVTARIPKNESAPVPIVPEAPSQKPMEEPAEEPPGALRDAEGEEQEHSSVSPDQSAPGPAESTATSSSNATPPSPSDSSSSSLHSILKKPSTSTLDERESEAAAGGGGKARQKDQKKARKPKIQKSVSFAEDTAAPAPAPPPKAKEAPPMTAAEEGAAIARKLVEWKATSQNGGKPSKDVGGGDGSADLGHSIQDSKHKGDAAYSTRGVGKHENRTEGRSDRTGAPGRGGVGTDGGGYKRAGNARMAQYLLPADENDGYVDDEIPRRWP